MKASHVRGILNAFKIPSQSMVKTMAEADAQSSKSFPLHLSPWTSPTSLSIPPLRTIYKLFLSLFIEREAGNIDDLTDLLAQDWAGLGTCREMGVDTARFFRTEMENLWGSKHLCVFSEDEAKHWVLGVRLLNPPFLYILPSKSSLEAVTQGRFQ